MTKKPKIKGTVIMKVPTAIAQQVRNFVAENNRSPIKREARFTKKQLKEIWQKIKNIELSLERARNEAISEALRLVKPLIKEVSRLEQLELRANKSDSNWLNGQLNELVDMIDYAENL